MKHFKILMAVAIIAVITVFIYSCAKENEKLSESDTQELSLNSQTRGDEIGNSCLETNQPFNAGSCFHGTYTNWIELPQYPGCHFNVSVEYYLCNSGIGSQALHLGDFVINDHDCQAYSDDVNDAIANNTILTFQLSFNSSVWAKLTTLLLNNLPNASTYLINAEYILAACKRTCYVEIERTPEGLSKIIPVENACSSECCSRNSFYRKINGVWELDHYTLSSPPTTCPNNTVSCPANTTFATNCIDGCAVLLGF